MSLDIIALWLGFLTLTFFGLWLIVKPAALRGVGVVAENADGRAELRAMYGGFELGIAAFLGLCLLRPDFTEPGLWMQLLALGGVGIGRLIGIAAEKGGVSKLLWFFAFIEIIAMLVTLAAVAQLY
jgi:hypothetical protein